MNRSEYESYKYVKCMDGLIKDTRLCEYIHPPTFVGYIGSLQDGEPTAVPSLCLERAFTLSSSYILSHFQCWHKVWVRGADISALCMGVKQPHALLVT